MTPASHRSARKPLAVGSALAALLFASFALAADRAPIDKASEQVSEALTVLKDVKAGNRAGDDHLDKARAYLNRARAELLKAQGQEAPE
ncbi:MAG: hypothetical protein ABUL60_32425 [Myxococcales bacterium]